MFDWELLARTSKPSTEAGRVKLSAFVREQNNVGITPFLTLPLLQQVERRPVPRLRDRALRVLTTIVEEFGHDLRSVFSVSQNLPMHAISYCANQQQMHVLLEILESYGWVTVHGLDDAVQITPAGLLQAEELSGQSSTYLQGFVVMSFDPAMNEVYTMGFDPAIREAGYRPFRIDGKEHINGISDEILAEIRRSRFLVADYSHMNNGVYFEAGLAVDLGIPVIPTCRADYLNKLHFDIRHINTLKWDTPQQLAVDLAKRISAVVGDGPILSADPHAPPRDVATPLPGDPA